MSWNWENIDYVNPIQPRKRNVVCLESKKPKKKKTDYSSFFKGFSYYPKETNTEPYESKEVTENIPTVVEEVDNGTSDRSHFSVVEGNCLKIRLRRKDSLKKDGVEQELRILTRGTVGKTTLIYNNELEVLYSKKDYEKGYIELYSSSLENIAREIIMMKEYNHPHIITLRKVSQTNSSINMYFDFIPCGELGFHLLKGVFPIEKVRMYSAQMVSVIEYLHKKGHIIRTLKPQNFVLDEYGDVVFVSLPLYISGKCQTFPGREENFAPEILIGDEHGKKVDSWNLGSIIYEMCIGLPQSLDKIKRHTH